MFWQRKGKKKKKEPPAPRPLHFYTVHIQSSARAIALFGWACLSSHQGTHKTETTSATDRVVRLCLKAFPPSQNLVFSPCLYRYMKTWKKLGLHQKQRVAWWQSASTLQRFAAHNQEASELLPATDDVRSERVQYDSLRQEYQLGEVALTCNRCDWRGWRWRIAWGRDPCRLSDYVDQASALSSVSTWWRGGSPALPGWWWGTYRPRAEHAAGKSPRIDQ